MLLKILCACASHCVHIFYKYIHDVVWSSEWTQTQRSALSLSLSLFLSLLTSLQDMCLHSRLLTDENLFSDSFVLAGETLPFFFTSTAAAAAAALSLIRIDKTPRNKWHLSHDNNILYILWHNNIHILMHAIVTPIFKLVHKYCHNGREMAFNSSDMGD